MSAKSYSLHKEKILLFHEDGLFDIFLGLFLLMAGAALWSGLVFMSGIGVAVLVPLWASARKSITFQRTPPGSLPAVSRVRSWAFISAMLGLFVIGIFAALAFGVGLENLPGLRAFLDTYIHLSIGGGLTLLLIFSAALLAAPRLAVLGIINAAVFVTAHLLGWAFWMSMTITGGCAVMIGCAVLIRFLREHPALG